MVELFVLVLDPFCIGELVGCLCPEGLFSLLKLGLLLLQSLFPLLLFLLEQTVKSDNFLLESVVFLL